MNSLLNNFFTNIGLQGIYTTIANKAVLIIAVILISLLVDVIAKKNSSFCNTKNSS